MAEYIERETVLSLTKGICVLTKGDSEYHHRSIDPGDVKELPAADVAPVRHGRWIYQGQKVIEETFPTYCCSSCFFLIPGNWRTNCRYCPNCGAKMEEEE